MQYSSLAALPQISTFSASSAKRIVIFNANAQGLPGARAAQTFGAAGRCYLAPFYIDTPIQLYELSFEIQAGVAGGKVHVGIYRDAPPTAVTPAGGNPQGGKLMIDSGEISTTTASAYAGSVSSPGVLTRGLYWAALHGNTNVTLAYYRYSTAAADLISARGTDKIRGCYFDQSFGALPATCPAVTGQAAEANFMFTISAFAI
jgi:hypothetical protein